MCTFSMDQINLITVEVVLDIEVNSRKKVIVLHLVLQT